MRIFGKKSAASTLSLLWAASSVSAVEIAGSNGREVDFAGVLEARPDGLVLMVNEGDDPITAPWSSIDMLRLELNNYEIHQAYEKSRLLNQIVPLKLGVYADMRTYDAIVSDLLAKLGEEHTHTVPQFEFFWEHVTGERTLNSFDTNERKQLKRVRADYEVFLDEFFKGQTQVTSASEYLLSTDISKDMVPLSGRDIINYFANPANKGSFGDAIHYLNQNSKHLDRIIRVLEKIQEEVPNSTFDAKNTDHNVLPDILRRTTLALQELKDRTIFNQNTMRDYRRMSELLVKARALADPE